MVFINPIRWWVVPTKLTTDCKVEIAKSISTLQKKKDESDAGHKTLSFETVLSTHVSVNM